ncbi:MAG: hypothetical protein ACKVY0_22170 [Prosthecobacter sp.]|uniref:hypothetical protein n=1 Tax=Prosthecobacter sp. TaxID=1965333 RepID=UPI0039012AD9
MPTALTWDQPGLTWDSATWDGVVAAPPRKTMNYTKAIIDFSGYTSPELGPDAHTIHDKMTTNAATFANPTVTMTALATLITTFDTALINRASGAKADVLALSDARDALEEALGVLGNYVNGIAKGDPLIVEQSGFPSYETTRTADTSPPAAPTNLRLRQGSLSGAIVARYKPDRQQSTNEVQITTGDPNSEAAWQTKGMFQGGKAEMSGFTPGSVVWVRVRTVGLKGVMGAWSDPAQIRVL